MVYLRRLVDLVLGSSVTAVAIAHPPSDHFALVYEQLLSTMRVVRRWVPASRILDIL